MATKIICSPRITPAPGQYLIAYDPSETSTPLGVSLFLGEVIEGGMQAAPPVPANWYAGMALMLRGPLGHGFHLPPTVQKLVLAALGETADRLMPLAGQVLSAGGDVALFADVPLTPIPAALEFYPLTALPEALPWADFIAVDVPLSELPNLRARLGLSPDISPPCPGQALVLTPMPCGGIAACGACAVPVRHGWKLACEDGPVFDLAELLV